MSLSQRGIAILQKVIQGYSYVSHSELMEQLSISKRTLYYDVEKINDWLQENKLEPLTHKRNIGYTVSEPGKQAIRQKLASLSVAEDYVYSPRERIAIIAIVVLTRESIVTLQTLLDKLHVSRSTMLADIKQAKAELKAFHLHLQYSHETGYFLKGSEQNKRTVLLTYLSQISELLDWRDLIGIPGSYKSSDMGGVVSSSGHTLSGVLQDLEDYMGVHYTEDFIHSLNIHITMLIKRFNRGKFISIDPVEKEVLRSTKEFDAATKIAERIETAYRLNVPEDEVFYLTTFFLSAKRSNTLPNTEDAQTASTLKQIISYMVDDFQKFACVFFTNRHELEQNLLLHLKPAYFRIKYGIDWSNPLSETVKSTYKDLFILTQKVVHHFEYFLGQPVSDDEIAYIAIHFGGWLDKEGIRVERRKKAVIVCASGIGTSRILQKQLEDLLPSVDVTELYSVREYEKKRLNNIDYIFSTVPLLERTVPVYVVSPILKASEKARLLKLVETDGNAREPQEIDRLIAIIKKHSTIEDEQALYQDLLAYQARMKEPVREAYYKPMLHELLTTDTIQISEETANWQEALQLASKPLLETGAIRQSYVDAMIDSVNQLGPYIVIAPGIALPHARPEAGVNKVGMSFLKLKKPCPFSEKPEHQVNLLFVLAAVDNEAHLKALSQLSTLLSDSHNLNLLSQAETVNEVLNVINNHSKSEEE
ncbi:BglG family transcription antiterminator [Bacillus testis]|uniref:BglG family transcription antiterminator n=1 Tax=Bacillus testis TaxID=1622072 RepID=UPI00067F2A54|nr:BglG family transcription antiterminator [Bacillus testis]